MNTVETVKIIVTSDPDADTSYLEQEDWQDRLEAYQRGDFGFCGLYLEATLRIPFGPKGYLLNTVRTPGLWSIETDSGEDYFLSVADDEYYTLAEMLNHLNAATPAKMDREVHYV